MKQKSVFSLNNLLWVIFIVAMYGLVQGLISAGIINAFYQITLITVCINIVAALSLNLIIGEVGLFSLGHAGFMCIGAYVGALIVKAMPNYVGVLLGALASMAVAGIVALIVGIPTLRLKGDYLAIATLGVSEIIRIIVLNMNVTGGASGLSNIPKLTNWTVCYIVIVFCLIVIINLVRSTHGRAAIAIKEDEIATESCGINVTKYKVTVFVIGAMLAALSGVLYATYFRVIKPEVFSFNKSIDILVIVVFGGIGSMTGSIIAGIALGLITMLLQSYAEYRMIMYAITIILIMIFRPQGLLGTKEFTISGIRSRLKGGKSNANTSNE